MNERDHAVGEAKAGDRAGGGSGPSAARLLIRADRRSSVRLGRRGIGFGWAFEVVHRSIHFLLSQIVDTSRRHESTIAQTNATVNRRFYALLPQEPDATVATVVRALR
jgi:hypothetical protein